MIKYFFVKIADYHQRHTQAANEGIIYEMIRMEKTVTMNSLSSPTRIK
jgi:hypothetical protein